MNQDAKFPNCFANIKLTFVLLGLACLMKSAEAQPKYNIVDLGTLGGSFSQAIGINSSGQVVGSSLTAGDQFYHAFRTAANSAINPATDDLGTLGGSTAFAFAINSSGQVVGQAATTGDQAYRAFRTAANSAINPATDDLGTLGGTSYAFAINSSGQVAGWAAQQSFHAFRTAANSAINPTTDDLGTLGGSESQAVGINSSGQVVGYAYLVGDQVFHAFRTVANSAINPATDDLGTLGGSTSQAFAINSSGQVVGSSATTGFFVQHAFRTAANSAINPATDDLGTLGGSESQALGINSSGQVVGYVLGDTFTHGFLYTAGVMYDLNNLIPAGSGWSELTAAYAINDAGQIVGWGFTHNGETHAFRLDLIDPTIDTTPPSCAVIGGGTNALGQRFTKISCQDKGSGLASIRRTKSSNYTVKIPAFDVGTTNPVVVIATKIDNALSAWVTLKLSDVAGNVGFFDPVDVQIDRKTGKPVTFTLTGIPQAESQISLSNGNPGLTTLYIAVNGTKLMVAGLRENEVRNINVSAAMVAGDNNTISFQARGRPGGSATILIHD